MKFIDSFRFMSSSLSKLVDNLSEGIHNNKCADCKSNPDYIKTTAERKNEKLILECYNCKQRYRKKFNKELIKRFDSTYEFCNNDLNKFVLLLRKGVYPYEYADTWERFNKISLPSKEDFYSNLNMEDISDIDYRHANNIDDDMSGGPRLFLHPPALWVWPILRFGGARFAGLPPPRIGNTQTAGGCKKSWGPPDISASTYLLISNLKSYTIH